MPTTYTELHYHCIWSTKNREPLITESIESSVWSIIAATANTHGVRARKIGGIENHLHALIDIPATLSVSEAMKRIKGGSSNDINNEGFGREQRSFRWQVGYGAFSVSTSKLESVAAYIERQREHHATQTFEEEFVTFLERHGVNYDPQYLWD